MSDVQGTFQRFYRTTLSHNG